ncbi:MAG: signal recognition particle-docking protein FtsY [Phycisphaeraceae bacterium]|nr:signal recognition particle-docking protein FtsY [Phycisphaeraceae bacterium]
MGLFSAITAKIKGGLAKTREVFVTGLKSLLLGRKLDEATIQEIRRRLIEADVGVKTTDRFVTHIQEQFRAGKIDKGDQVLDYLKSELRSMWPPEDRELRLSSAKPTVILVTGVNGAGKTTSISKLAKLLQSRGNKVMLGACDTFRAGAVRQLEIWGERLGIDVVKGQQGGDPAAVAFDACQAAKSRGADVLIIDTAGRLQTQDPLMRQLTKIRLVVGKQIPGAPHEVLLVLDATAGQNALRQAEEFDRAIAGAGANQPKPADALGVTGIFLAKLDGTAKGGIVVAIKEATKIPVKFIGVGETPDDVQPFEPEKFVDALFEE